MEYNEKEKDDGGQEKKSGEIESMQRKKVPFLTIGGLFLAVLAALLPGLPVAGRLLFAAAAIALVAADCVLQMRMQARREEEFRELQRRLSEAESRNGQAEARAREEAERRRAQTKEKLAAFYSKVSHSLRIPISVIQGYADLLGSGLIQDENVKREYLNKIRADYKVFGIDDEADQLAALTKENGIYYATVAQNPFEIGVRVMEAAVHAVEGQDDGIVKVDGILVTRDTVQEYVANREKALEELKDYLAIITAS